MAAASRRERRAPVAFLSRPRSLVEISDAGDLLGMDVLFEPQHQWIAEEFLATDVPEGWAECLDQSSGRVYYWNESTEETSWENPAEKQFAGLYKRERKLGEASGVAIIQLASRAAAREREVQLVKGGAPGAATPPRGSRRNSVSTLAAQSIGTPGNSRPPTAAGSAAGGKSRRGSTKWIAPEGAMGPAQLMDLAE